MVDTENERHGSVCRVTMETQPLGTLIDEDVLDETQYLH